LKIWVGSCF